MLGCWVPMWRLGCGTIEHRQLQRQIHSKRKKGELFRQSPRREWEAAKQTTRLPPPQTSQPVPSENRDERLSNIPWRGHLWGGSQVLSSHQGFT